MAWAKMKADMIAVYADDDAAGRLAMSLRDCVPAPATEAKPAAAIVQISTEERRRTAIGLLRKRVPVAVLGAVEGDLAWLGYARATAERNRVPAVLLGSWRYIPAVAALKEIACSGCLGPDLKLRAALGKAPDALEKARLDDAASWLSGGGAEADARMAEMDALFRLEGENGFAEACFMLDGTDAGFHASICGRERRRRIPQAFPLESELAIFALTVEGQEKVRDLHTLMNLADCGF